MLRGGRLQGPHLGARRGGWGSAAQDWCVFYWCGFGCWFFFFPPGATGNFIAGLS